MKIQFIALPLLLAAAAAMADGVDRETEAAYSEAGGPDKAQIAQAQERRMARQKVKRLPRGDLRYCLNLRTNAEIIRCAETGRKR
jgi:hypothetical protein